MDTGYTLKSGDGKMFEVGMEVVSHCQLLQFVIEDCDSSLQAELKPMIPTPMVNGETLRDFIKLAKAMDSHPEICKKYLLDVDIPILVQLIAAADYLISPKFLELAVKVANDRISEESCLDMLNKHLSPSRSGHFADILVDMRSMKV